MMVLRVLWMPMSVLLVMLGWIWLDRLMGWRGPKIVWLGASLAIGGLLLMLWCAGLFLLKGRGSPHPFVAKTKRIVDSGPYGIVRNPMMVGVGMSLIGLCFWFGLAGLWLGFIGFLAFLHWWVPLYEERDMERRFGEEYRDYCRRVPRWIPRLRQTGRPRAKDA